MGSAIRGGHERQPARAAPREAGWCSVAGCTWTWSRGASTRPDYPAPHRTSTSGFCRCRPCTRQGCLQRFFLGLVERTAHDRAADAAQCGTCSCWSRTGAIPHQAAARNWGDDLPDERWGQCITAFIKRAPNADVAVEPATLDAWCRATSLADYKRPRDYVFVAEIPKSPVGKILRRLLVAGEYRRE